MVMNGKRYRLRKWVKVVLIILTLVSVVSLMMGAYKRLLNGPKTLEEALEVNGYELEDYGSTKIWRKK